MVPRDLEVAVWSEFDDSAIWGLSVVAAAGMTVEQLLAERPQRHSVYRKSTAEAVRAAGFGLVADPEDPFHWLIVLKEAPIAEHWVKLTNAFEAPVGNPNAQ
jgi:hypothetical protein